MFIIRRVLYRLLSLIKTTYYSCHRNIRIGKGSVIFYQARIVNFSKRGGVGVGTNCRIGTYSYGYHSGLPFYTTLQTNGGLISIGNECRINGAFVNSLKSISIGDNCVIAAGVNIMDSNGHLVKSKNRTKEHDAPQAIVIGNNVWIGLNAIILKGTIIGDNCVIGANTVVKGEFPANTIITNGDVKCNIIKF